MAHERGTFQALLSPLSETKSDVSQYEDAPQDSPEGSEAENLSHSVVFLEAQQDPSSFSNLLADILAFSTCTLSTDKDKRDAMATTGPSTNPPVSSHFQPPMTNGGSKEI